MESNPSISFLQVAGSGGGKSRLERRFLHPLFALLKLRPILAQHTHAEHEAMKNAAAMRHTLVEIGVAEGASAIALREGMASDGQLFLIDPFHLSRLHFINSLRFAAHRAVNQCKRGNVTWIQRFSHEVAPLWVDPIDLLLLDGDHSEKAVWQDWEEWSKFVMPGGVVLFHDARLFEGGWTTPEYGPVRVVNALFRKSWPSDWRIIQEVDSVVVVQRIGN